MRISALDNRSGWAESLAARRVAPSIDFNEMTVTCYGTTVNIFGITGVGAFDILRWLCLMYGYCSDNGWEHDPFPGYQVVNYDYEASWGGGDLISLVCEPAAVTRGEMVTCIANRGPTPGALVQEWTFESTEHGPMGRSDSNSDTVWAGKVATPGTVRVVMNISGTLEHRSALLTVNPRTGWSSMQPVFSTNAVASDLLVPPLENGDLGRTRFEVAVAASAYERIAGGPNDFVSYMTSMHDEVVEIKVNYAGFAVNSQLWTLSTLSTTPYCSRSFVENSLAGLIRWHEGMNFETNSHAERYRRSLITANVGSLVEAFTEATGGVSPSQIKNLLLSQRAAAENLSLVADDNQGGNPVSFPLNCALRFVP